MLQIRTQPDAIERRTPYTDCFRCREQICEYSVQQKCWSADERQASTSLLSRFQYIDMANEQAERLYKHTDAKHPLTYSVKFKGWKTSTPNSFSGVCYQGVYVFTSDPNPAASPKDLGLTQ